MSCAVPMHRRLVRSSTRFGSLIANAYRETLRVSGDVEPWILPQVVCPDKEQPRQSFSTEHLQFLCSVTNPQSPAAAIAASARGWPDFRRRSEVRRAGSDRDLLGQFRANLRYRPIGRPLGAAGGRRHDRHPHEVHSHVDGLGRAAFCHLRPELLKARPIVSYIQYAGIV